MVLYESKEDRKKRKGALILFFLLYFTAFKES
jgi:hypothetical protein